MKVKLYLTSGETSIVDLGDVSKEVFEFYKRKMNELYPNVKIELIND